MAHPLHPGGVWGPVLPGGCSPRRTAGWLCRQPGRSPNSPSFDTNRKIKQPSPPPLWGVPATERSCAAGADPAPCGRGGGPTPGPPLTTLGGGGGSNNPPPKRGEQRSYWRDRRDCRRASSPCHLMKTERGRKILRAEKNRGGRSRWPWDGPRARPRSAVASRGPSGGEGRPRGT